jgi:hypothetical protein
MCALRRGCLEFPQCRGRHRLISCRSVLLFLMAGDDASPKPASASCPKQPAGLSSRLVTALSPMRGARRFRRVRNRRLHHRRPCRVNDVPRWTRHEVSPRAAPWRITRCVNHIGLALDRRAPRSPAPRVANLLQSMFLSASSSVGLHPIPTLARKPSTTSSNLQKLPKRALAPIKTQIPSI